ncbi:MAG: hypothetical protein NC084_03385 [Bacteroides sp.]|nr:hypothetical protein [Eubacterium sp.]MCM1419751.1 hypothetical protein [Roseburia sp.]MCM1461740.1 hypothetical protein [Bacteroides sp.]
MKKRTRSLSLLLTLALCGCATEADAPTELTFAVERVYSPDYALSDEELAERYADLLPKLYPFGAENVEERISAEGLAYFTEIRERALEDYALGEYEEQDEEALREMYDFMLDERHFFPAADGGLFAVYGYRLIGGEYAAFYDVFYLSVSEEALLYSERLPQVSADFLGNGEKLMIFLYDMPLAPCRILDRYGETGRIGSWDIEVVVPADVGNGTIKD